MATQGEFMKEVMEEFLAAGDLGPEAWQKHLRARVAPVVEAQIRKESKKWKAAGLPAPTPAEIQLAVDTVIEDADDIRDALVTAYQEGVRSRDAITAGLSVEGFLSPKRLAYTAASLIQRGLDLTVRRVFRRAAADPESQFTGRKQFVADPNGRHGAINGVIKQEWEAFELPARTINGRKLSAKKIAWARENPKDALEWSNSTSKVLLEKVDKDGNVTWVEV